MTYTEGWQVASTNTIGNVMPTSAWWASQGITHYGITESVTAYSGGVFDSRRCRLIVWGGGHGDYYGNEIYALPLGSLPGTWVRLNNPSIWTPTLVEPYYIAVEVMPDGNPCSRHTYCCIAYMSHIDRLFAIGGAKAGGSGGNTNETWTFDFETGIWQQMNPSGTPPSIYSGMMASAYDPVTKLIYTRHNTGLYSYSYETNSWVGLKSSQPFVDVDFCMARVDPVKRRLVHCDKNYVTVTDLTPPNYTCTRLVNSSGGPIPASRGPGFDYHPGIGQFVAWDSTSTSTTYTNIYTLDIDSNPGTAQWTSHALATYPNAPSGGAAFGRFQFIPELNGFICNKAQSQTANFYQLPKSVAWTPLTDGQWTVRSKVKDGAPGSSGKHNRCFHNPTDGKLYLMGGDHNSTIGVPPSTPYYSDMMGLLQSGRNEFYTYRVKEDVWVEEQPCWRIQMPSPGTLIQPGHPDQCSIVWDSRRSRLWLVPGYMWSGGVSGCIYITGNPYGFAPHEDPACPEISTSIMYYDPYGTKQWTDTGVVPPTSERTTAQAGFCVYDSVTDSITRLSTASNGWTRVRRYLSDVATRYSYTISTSASGIGQSACAFDPRPGKRHIYFVPELASGANSGLWRLALDEFPSETLVKVASLPTGGYAPLEEINLLWNSVENVLHYMPFVDKTALDMQMWTWNPDSGGPWEQDAMIQPDLNYPSPGGRHAFFDPYQNVVIAYAKSAVMYLYRYGGGGSPVPIAPDPPTNLRIVR